MSEYLKELLSKKNLINILILAILVLAIPLTINLVRQQQILFSKAATDSVQLVDNVCTTLIDGKKVLTCPTVRLNFVAPSETEVLSAAGFAKTAYAVACDLQGNIGNWRNCSTKESLMETLLTLDQPTRDLLPNEAVTLYTNDVMKQTFSLNRLSKLPGTVLRSFGNGDLLAIADASGLGRKAFLSNFDCPRIGLFTQDIKDLFKDECGFGEGNPTPSPSPTVSTCPTRPLSDIGNEELIAKCTLAEIALLPNDRLITFDMKILERLPNSRLEQFKLDFLAGFRNERLGQLDLKVLVQLPNSRLQQFTIPFLQNFSNDRLITMDTSVLKQFPESRIRTFPCEVQIQLGYQCSIQSIFKVRYAENSSDLSNPNLRREIAYIPGGVQQDITFSTSTPGTKFIYAQFLDDKNQTQNANPFPFRIDLIGPTPLVSGFACEIDIVNSSDLLFKFIGTNFGSAKGTVALRAGGSLTIDGNWTDTAVVARLSSPPKSATTLGTQYFATLTNSSGQKSAEQQCGVGITQISLGAKLFCRAQRDFDQENVDLVIVSEKDRNQKTTEKVVIDKDGNITNMKTKLKSGDNYFVCIKAPLSLRRCSAVFTAISGTNNINLSLPIGDYNNDGNISIADGIVLRSQWGPVNSSKNCDVNRDRICNAFEWSCMLHDFPSSDKVIP